MHVLVTVRPTDINVLELSKAPPTSLSVLTQQTATSRWYLSAKMHITKWCTYTRGMQLQCRTGEVRRKTYVVATIFARSSHNSREICHISSMLMLLMIHLRFPGIQILACRLPFRILTTALERLGVVSSSAEMSSSSLKL